MRRVLPYLAALALIVGVGLLVYGLKGGIPCHSIATGRGFVTSCPGPDVQSVMAVGAMLVTAGILGLRYR